MKRPIKFRALKDDQSNCNWVYGRLVYDAAGIPRITEVDSSGKGLTFHTCIAGTEGQFTGLLDKNSKEVYEDDFLKIVANQHFGYFQKSDGSYAQYQVKFEGCEYILSRTDTEFNWGRLSRIEELSYECELAGNIYENPELLIPNNPTHEN